MWTLDTLPQDIHLLILYHLEASDLFRLQLVSHSFQTIFSDPVYLRTILSYYPKVREVRELLRQDLHALSSSSPNTEAEAHKLHSILNTIATRYHHLTRGASRHIQRLSLRALDQSGHWLPTPQWDYHESQPGGRLYHEHASHLSLRSVNGVSKPYLFRPTLWSYDDGFVVYASTGEIQKGKIMGWQGAAEPGEEDRCLVVLDLQGVEQVEVEVPFDVMGKIIRNLRLKEGILVVEWAEEDAFHDLNMVDKVHRHFATAYKVTRMENTSQPLDSDLVPLTTTKLDVQFWSEWRIHFLGFPLTSRDHFFTTHTSTHYCMYYWQPNRSLWTGDEDQPIEALKVWDISQPNSYRPSEDPGGVNCITSGKEGPNMVANFAMGMLGFLGVRQQARISLMGLRLDSSAGTVTVRSNVFESGQGYFDPAERTWCANEVTFPFKASGPVYRREGHIELPGYRGHCSMETAAVEDIERWFLPVMDVVDEEADVRYSLVETCFTGMMMAKKMVLRCKVFGEWKDLRDEVATELGVMGRIAGDERWVVGQNERLQLVVARFQ